MLWGMNKMYTKEFMNNFHCYFPCGEYRKIKIGQRKEKIISVLDRLLEKFSFNFEEFDKEKSLWFDKTKKVYKIAKNNGLEEEIKRIGKESEQHCQKVQEIIKPFYIKMRSMGFSENELTS